MKKKYKTCILLAAVFCAALLAGCGNKTLSADALSVCRTDIGGLAVPENVQIVGLGEAGHGVKEYHQMKAEVFKALVRNNGCRTFIIEGDFGGCLKVDAYINGGEGTAQEAVKEIGFHIYNTQELADLAEWMREYNETAAEGEKLHFYGMDMQRYDNNQEYLFSVLDTAAPDLSGEYRERFRELTDEARSSLSDGRLAQAQEDARSLLDAMDEKEQEIALALGQTAFDFARECANSILESSELCASGNNYNTLRDGHMKEKVEWFLQHGDKTPLFINGHNGHIGKVSASGYPCLGSLLAEAYGDAYFAIGTDAEVTRFNSQNGDGSFTEREVKNSNGLNAQLNGMDSGFYYLNFSEAEKAGGWQEVTGAAQSITTLNVGIGGWQKFIKAFYTQKLVPADTFDGMIVFRQVSPTTLI